MRKILTIAFVAILVAYGCFCLYAARAVQQAASKPWPAGLGTLASMPDHFPTQSENEAARTLTRLATPLGIPFQRTAHVAPPYGDAVAAIGDYLGAERTSGEQTIADPPAAVTTFLAAHASEIAAIRQHLLSDAPIAWSRDIAADQPPIPNLLGHMTIAKLFAASALVRAHQDDAGAWDDLHAAWNLSRSLHEQPDLITQLIALAMARVVNSVAWKMPSPAPQWLMQMDAVDHTHLLLRSMQYEKWFLWTHGSGNKPEEKARMARIVEGILWPFVRLTLANMIDHDRETALQLAAVTECGFDATAFYKRRLEGMARWNKPGRIMSEIEVSNIAAMWKRTFRYRAEREATRNALARSASPSRCSDGTWSFDGTTLRFSREIPKSTMQESVMPLTLKLNAGK
jgi:hypothetical protein